MAAFASGAGETDEVLQEYNSEFDDVCSRISALMAKAKTTPEGERRAVVAEIQKLLKEAEAALKDIKGHYNTMPPKARKAGKTQLVLKENQINHYKQTLLRGFSDGGKASASQNSALKDRQATAFATMQAGTSKLEQSQRTMAETEETAAGIMEQLVRRLSKLM